MSVPTVLCLLSVFEDLINHWEAMRGDDVYSSIHSVLDTGVKLLGKYYDMTDGLPLAVISTGM